jgi:uncharacterized membrane protein
MQSKVKLFGHPVHQMLIVFPLGLLATAVIFDLIHIASGRPLMAVVAHWMIAAGLVGGLVAAPFGLIDWLAIPAGTRAKAVGAMHGGGNVLVLLLFAGSWFLRMASPELPGTVALALSFVGAAIACVTAWLGGELVDRLGVGVYEDAGLNAPNSLHAGKPLRERTTAAR